jgi:hypothetical protein
MSVVSRQGEWGHFALSLVTAGALIVVIALAAAHFLDPYDTGRSPLVQRPGVRPQGPRTAGASRGRDLAFNAAVFGNSRIQLLSPERLNGITGLSFVQLSVPGTGPKEQLTLIQWFMRHHPDARALVIGADKNWCTADPAMRSEHPFPYWLYSPDLLEYALGLLRSDVLQELPRRLGYLFAEHPARARPDGYWDYELNYAALGFDRDPAWTRLDLPSPANVLENTTGRFPAAERLRELASALSPRVKLAVVFPPIYARLLPKSGTMAEAAEAACKGALAGAVAGQPNAVVIDWRRDRPLLNDPGQFFDGTHYRRPVAEALEQELGAALTGAGRNF